MMKVMENVTFTTFFKNNTDSDFALQFLPFQGYFKLMAICQELQGELPIGLPRIQRKQR